MKPPIIVTGCQRSGTRIAARILADDFQLQYVDEFEADFHNLQTNTIVHSPLALHGYIETYYTYPGVHFVGVIRDPAEIIASMKRIKWLQGDVKGWESFLPHYVGHQLRLWKLLKQELPQESWSEIQYDSLKSHRLFVDKEDRKEFTSLQWKFEQPEGPRFWDKNRECLIEHQNSLKGP